MLNKTYSSVIVILVIVVALLSISLFNQKDGQKVQSTNLIEENNTENNMDENTNNKKEVLEKVEQENGLVIEILKRGEGAVAENNKTVAVHYTGKFEDGTVFDSSIERGTPIEFELGTGRVIAGWDLGIVNMKVGEKRILTIPYQLGYGPDGYGPIPGGATLIFDVELVDVK